MSTTRFRWKGVATFQMPALANNNKMSANINLCCEVRWREITIKCQQISTSASRCAEGKPENPTKQWHSLLRKLKISPISTSASRRAEGTSIPCYSLQNPTPPLVNTPPMVKSKSRFIVSDTVNPLPSFRNLRDTISAICGFILRTS